jgi:5'-3' exonuclease
MGVPNFFSWLIKRYPMSLYDIDEVFYGNYNKNLDSYTLSRLLIFRYELSYL